MSDKPRGTEGTQRTCGNTRELAREGDTRIAECSCGPVHVHMGAVTVRLSKENFAELARATQIARIAMNTGDYDESVPVGQVIN